MPHLPFVSEWVSLSNQPRNVLLLLPGFSEYLFGGKQTVWHVVRPIHAGGARFFCFFFLFVLFFFLAMRVVFLRQAGAAGRFWAHHPAGGEGIGQAAAATGPGCGCGERGAGGDPTTTRCPGGVPVQRSTF